jgi:hypothetical protein
MILRRMQTHSHFQLLAKPYAPVFDLWSSILPGQKRDQEIDIECFLPGHEDQHSKERHGQTTVPDNP